MIAKIEHHLGELFPRVGFIVTTLTGTNRAVVRFYNQRGTAEQWIKEGKEATHWARLSCHRFRANEVPGDRAGSKARPATFGTARRERSSAVGMVRLSLGGRAVAGLGLWCTNRGCPTSCSRPASGVSPTPSHRGRSPGSAPLWSTGSGRQPLRCD